MGFSDRYLALSDHVDELKIGFTASSILINSEGNIGGIQINTEGDYLITDVILPADWEYFNGPAGIVILNLSGKSGKLDVNIIYEGNLQITDYLASDLFGNSISSSLFEIPNEFFISNPYPNPFNPITNLDFGIPTDCNISIDIYNIQGRLIESLLNGNMGAGYHTINWNADAYSSGMYFINIHANPINSNIMEQSIETQKLLLIK